MNISKLKDLPSYPSYENAAYYYNFFRKIYKMMNNVNYSFFVGADFVDIQVRNKKYKHSINSKMLKEDLKSFCYEYKLKESDDLYKLTRMVVANISVFTKGCWNDRHEMLQKMVFFNQMKKEYKNILLMEYYNCDEEDLEYYRRS